jgi:tRNA dimethylallyltransferase
LSIILANHFKAEIISCDSQFFKEMTIGTAVPTTAELTTAPHHFIQNKSIFETTLLVNLKKKPLKKIDDLF